MVKRLKYHHMQLFDYINYIVIIILCVIFLYPVLLTLMLSLTDPSSHVSANNFFPKKWTIDAFRFLLSDSRLMRYYANSIFYCITSTIIFLMVTSLTAYPLIIPHFKGKRFFNILIIITMFFGGGLVPAYININNLRMVNTIWVMIIPGAVGAYNVVIFRTFFSAIPSELRESAHMDGAGHITIFAKIMLPVSKPLLATFTLFNIVGKWNDFLTAVMFLRDDNLMPMQVLLRKMLIQMSYRDMDNSAMYEFYAATTNTRSVKCAAVIITILPILFIYPFVQKHFVKGMLVGSLKS